MRLEENLLIAKKKYTNEGLYSDGLWYNLQAT